MIFSRVAAGILTAFAVCSAAEVPEYFRKGIAGVFPEAKQFREIREKEFAVEDGAGKLLGSRSTTPNAGSAMPVRLRLLCCSMRRSTWPVC